MNVCAEAQVVEVVGIGDDNLFHAIIKSAEGVVELGYHATLDYAHVFELRKLGLLQHLNHAVVVLVVHQHAVFLETESQRHVVA